MHTGSFGSADPEQHYVWITIDFPEQSKAQIQNQKLYLLCFDSSFQKNARARRGQHAALSTADLQYRGIEPARALRGCQYINSQYRFDRA